eukprot:4019470-Ditylum_brightwellii.AAC.1
MVVKWRTLEFVIKFLVLEDAKVPATATMSNILKRVRESKNQHHAHQQHYLLMQTAEHLKLYKRHLSRSACSGDIVEEACSRKLYSMILSCVGDGSALNIIEKAKSNNGDVECGYQA